MHHTCNAAQLSCCKKKQEGKEENKIALWIGLDWIPWQKKALLYFLKHVCLYLLPCIYFFLHNNQTTYCTHVCSAVSGMCGEEAKSRLKKIIVKLYNRDTIIVFIKIHTFLFKIQKKIIRQRHINYYSSLKKNYI